MTEANKQQVNPADYTTDVLVDWFVKLRDYKAELKKSIQPQMDETDKTMDLIQAELNKRLMEQNLASMKTAGGTVSRVEKQKFTVSDPYALRQWVIANPEIGVNLLTGSISQPELRAYLQEYQGKDLPDGVVIENILDLSVRRS